MVIWRPLERGTRRSFRAGCRYIMYNTGVRKGIFKWETRHARRRAQFEDPHISSPREYRKGMERDKANKKVGREEDDTTDLPHDQRRVEMGCLLTSRTSFAARSRRIFRRIFPDGLKKR